MTDLQRRLEQTEREVARGQSERTPWLVLSWVTLLIAGVAAVVIAATLLIWIYAG
jgi:hypothetical protein